MEGWGWGWGRAAGRDRSSGEDGGPGLGVGKGSREREIGSIGLTCTQCPFENKQQGPTVEHRELCSIFCDKLPGKRI